MGQAKNEGIKHQEMVEAATAICIKHEFIKECDLHSDSYTSEYSDANEVVDVILQNDPNAGAGFSSRDYFVECVDQALSECGWDCGYCANNAED